MSRRGRGRRPSWLFAGSGRSDANPLLVACPFCHAGIGQPCARLKGGSYHDSRAEDAKVRAACTAGGKCGWPECRCSQQAKGAAR